MYFAINNKLSFDYYLEKAKNKTYKRCFGLLNQYERKIIRWKQPKTIRIAVSGPRGSGVSSFLHRYFHHQFLESDSILRTIYYFKKEIEIDDKKICFEFVSAPDYREAQLIKDVYGVVIICDISSDDTNDIASLNRIIKNAIFSNAQVELPVLFCLNKVDLIKSNPETLTKLTPEHLEKFAYTNTCSYYEIMKISVLDNLNIDNAMGNIMKRAYFTSKGNSADLWRRKEALMEIVEIDKGILEKSTSSCLLC